MKLGRALVAELARLPELIEQVLAQNEAIAAVAARMAAEIRAASPCHYLLQMQIGDLPPAIAQRLTTAGHAA